MGIVASIFIALAIGTIAASIIYIAHLTVNKLKELIRARKEKNAKQEVVFGNTRKIFEEYGKEIIQSSPTMTMEELEELCDESPFFVVNYDSQTDEVVDYQTIKTDAVDNRVSDIIKDKGIVVFT